MKPSIDSSFPPNPPTIPEAPPEPPKRLWLNILLFCLTFITTTFTGALSNLESMGDLLSIGPWLEGMWYSVPLLTILTAHEMGHYLAAKRHNVPVTLPYFIPGIPPFGTFGAFIRMRPKKMSRRALMEVGAYGPLAGLVFALPFLYVGLSISEIRPLPEDLDTVMQMGDSILGHLGLMLFFEDVPRGSDIYLHPLAYAGWVGLFVTAFNLIPIGQLDGGHICYALFGPNHNKSAVFLYGCLLVVGVVLHPGWLVLCVLLALIGIKHPPITDHEPLPRFQQLIGWFSIAVFFLTFIPKPIDSPTISECVSKK